LAYSPGVAAPCLEIEKEPRSSYDYTNRGNLIAVVTNGTAVLGLGNIGALAGKPVMEGKAVLFKRFANIDVFDIELNTTDPDEFIQTVRLMAPTFGGINLEDIKAPDCFYIEEELKKQMPIPVFHDDQHGTAIISAAAMLNAVAITNRRIEALRVVINGAGAAGIACGRLYIQLGVKPEHLMMVDTRGVIYKGREEGMNPYKEALACDTSARSLEEAVAGSDLIVGLSVKGAFTPQMLKRMNPDPVIFALANPDPEIDYHEAKAARPDAIVATGRSDFPNQVNNVLGFPFIFRGALDVRATEINERMKEAAVHALADLAREDVPDAVIASLWRESHSLRSGVHHSQTTGYACFTQSRAGGCRSRSGERGCRTPITETKQYLQRLEAGLGPERELMRKIMNRAQQDPKRIVLPEGDQPVIIRAAHQAAKEGIAQPFLLGDPVAIRETARKHHLSLDGMELLESSSERTSGSIYWRIVCIEKKKRVVMDRDRGSIEKFIRFRCDDGQGRAGGRTGSRHQTVLSQRHPAGTPSHTPSYGGEKGFRPLPGDSEKQNPSFCRHDGKYTPGRRGFGRDSPVGGRKGSLFRHGNRVWRCSPTPISAVSATTIQNEWRLRRNWPAKKIQVSSWTERFRRTLL
jgi:malate dehydrogenase (oxaloacetate-decarboxylating)(NADP+)